MRRREFMLAGAAAVVPDRAAPSILVHEHILVDFVGAEQIRPGRYNPSEVFQIALPKLQALKRWGCRRMQECTPNYLGRDPALLARLSDAAEIEIWSNTGLYGAADHKFVPAFARTQTAAQLAAAWIAESREAWHPRFIKTGVNNGPLDEMDRKLIRAAAITSRETGLTIASHTGNGKAAVEQLEIVVEEKVAPGKFVWVHAQKETHHAYHERIARAGAWVEFDAIGSKSVPFHLECIRYLAERNLSQKVLISQDSGWYHVGEPRGGEFHGYTFFYSDFLPLLPPALVPVLLWENPRAAFGI